MRRGVWIVDVRRDGDTEWCPTCTEWFLTGEGARGRALDLNASGGIYRYRAVRYVPATTPRPKAKRKARK